VAASLSDEQNMSLKSESLKQDFLTYPQVQRFVVDNPAHNIGE
jgi:hypothetical protein